MNRIRNLGIKKNDIVRIRFKNLNAIIKESRMTFSDLDDSLRLSSNMRAYYNGGDFLVSEDFDKNEYDVFFGDTLHLKNHFDSDYGFVVCDFVIESIEIVNDARRFISSELDLIVIRVDDELFINGQPLIGDELQKKKEHNRYKTKKDEESEYTNENRKLLKIFEEFITDLAMKDSMSTEKRG